MSKNRSLLQNVWQEIIKKKIWGTNSGRTTTMKQERLLSTDPHIPHSSDDRSCTLPSGSQLTCSRSTHVETQSWCFLCLSLLALPLDYNMHSKRRAVNRKLACVPGGPCREDRLGIWKVALSGGGLRHPGIPHPYPCWSAKQKKGKVIVCRTSRDGTLGKE